MRLNSVTPVMLMFLSRAVQDSDSLSIFQKTVKPLSAIKYQSGGGAFANLSFQATFLPKFFNPGE
jgi:hypothetical protein